MTQCRDELGRLGPLLVDGFGKADGLGLELGDELWCGVNASSGAAAQLQEEPTFLMSVLVRWRACTMVSLIEWARLECCSAMARVWSRTW